jgi:hypothetical protein
MTRKTRKAVAFAIAILSVGTVAAFAASSPPVAGVTKSAMNGVDRAAGAHGALKANAVGNRQIKFGSVSCGKLSLDLKAALCTGKLGAPGAPGASGAKGEGGSNGKSGSTGGQGDQGNTAPGVVTTHAAGADSSTCGGDWADDTYTRTLQFIPQDNGTINVLRTYRGTFTTIAHANGPSGPCLNDQVGGVSGTFTGFDVVVVTGGHFFPDATCDANCTSAAMLAAFFPGATSAIHNGWEYHYDAGDNGTWINADAVSRGGNSGDITG